MGSLVFFVVPLAFGEAGFLCSSVALLHFISSSVWTVKKEALLSLVISVTDSEDFLLIKSMWMVKGPNFILLLIYFVGQKSAVGLLLSVEVPCYWNLLHDLWVDWSADEVKCSEAHCEQVRCGLSLHALLYSLSHSLLHCYFGTACHKWHTLCHPAEKSTDWPIMPCHPTAGVLNGKHALSPYCGSAE